jgi:glutathione synthase
MNHLFVVDPLESLLPAVDSSIALMREAASRGGRVEACEADSLGIAGDRTVAMAVSLNLPAGDEWYQPGPPRQVSLIDYDVVWMRKDPPFNANYRHATLLLSQAAESTLVVNDPQALRDINEKLFALRFPQFCPASRVSSSVKELLEFRADQGSDIVIKPLDDAAGRGVLRICTNDENARSLLEISTAAGTRRVLAQQYLPAVKRGDKRIILADGNAAGAVLRVPCPGEFRANLHNGATAVQTTLTAREREICQVIGAELRARGVVFAGIDVIGDYLTEVNVTSPTGLLEIRALDGTRIEAEILDAVEQRRQERFPNGT